MIELKGNLGFHNASAERDFTLLNDDKENGSESEFQEVDTDYSNDLSINTLAFIWFCVSQIFLIKNYVFYKKVRSVIVIQRHILSPVKHPRWSFLAKQVTTLIS